jgi:hypothetical protein
VYELGHVAAVILMVVVPALVGEQCAHAAHVKLQANLYSSLAWKVTPRQHC